NHGRGARHDHHGQTARRSYPKRAGPTSRLTPFGRLRAREEFEFARVASLAPVGENYFLMKRSVSENQTILSLGENYFLMKRSVSENQNKSSLGETTFSWRNCFLMKKLVRRNLEEI